MIFLCALWDNFIIICNYVKYIINYGGFSITVSNYQIQFLERFAKLVVYMWWVICYLKTGEETLVPKTRTSRNLILAAIFHLGYCNFVPLTPLLITIDYYKRSHNLPKGRIYQFYHIINSILSTLPWKQLAGRFQVKQTAFGVCLSSVVSALPLDCHFLNLYEMYVH